MADDQTLLATADERPMLCGFLDWQRAVTVNKVDGLDFEQATRVHEPSGLTVLGLVQHLAWAERVWFRSRFAGEDVDLIGVTGPPSERQAQFVIEPGTTIESVLALHADETARSRRITEAAASLDELTVNSSPHYGDVSLRWVLVHMIEETARHNGHLDLVREAIDGRTGD